ncbi:hypothetical protein D1872_145660 [compost metagenome]
MPKEVAKAIKTLENEEITTLGIICSLAHERWGHSKHVSEAHKVLRKFSFGNSGGNTDIILKALVNDYEVELTPEEKVLEHYKLVESNLSPGEDNSSRDAYLERGILIGTKTTLDLLGIKIEGINA